MICVGRYSLVYVLFTSNIIVVVISLRNCLKLLIIRDFSLVYRSVDNSVCRHILIHS